MTVSVLNHIPEVMNRSVSRWAYAQRETDLFITSGMWFKTLTVIPYARMQVVELSSGPLMRRRQLAALELKTASATGSGRIPGLPLAEARRLREELSRLGEDQAAGL